MLTLMVSWDCGGSYSPEFKTDDIEKIKTRGKELDKEMLRWYVEEDGKINMEFISLIHSGILIFLTKMNQDQLK